MPSDGEAKTTKLLVLNSGQRAIPVQNVVVTPVSEAVTVSFRPQKISPDTLRPAVVAQVTFDRKFVCRQVSTVECIGNRLAIFSFFGVRGWHPHRPDSDQVKKQSV